MEYADSHQTSLHPFTRVPSHSQLHQSSPPNNKPRNICNSSICKFLVIIICLAVVLFFPSQAPKTANLSVFTSFWELLHLLLIGIAVSYGLFSRRRNADLGIKNEVSLDDFRSKMSTIFHFQSVSQYGSGGSSVLEDYHDPRSSIPDDGIENPDEIYENSVDQNWSSPCGVEFHKTNHVFHKWNGEKVNNFYRPLGLPVRSLKSVVIDTDSSDESSRKSESCLSFNFNGGVENVLSMNFDDMGFKERHGETETPAIPSPIPWRTRSMKKEKEEETITRNHSSHSGSTKYFSSPECSASSSSSISSEFSNLKTEELGLKNSSFGCPLADLEEPSMKTSAGSSSGTDVQASCENDLKMEEMGTREDSSSGSPLVSLEQLIEMDRKAPRSRSRARRNSSRSYHTCVQPKCEGDLEGEKLRGKKNFHDSSMAASPLSSGESPPLFASSEMSVLRGCKDDEKAKELDAKKISLLSSNESSKTLSMAPTAVKKSRRHGTESSFHVNDKRFSKDGMKGLGWSGKEEDFSKMSTKPAGFGKASARGKSVRTIRANKLAANAKRVERICENQSRGETMETPDEGNAPFEKETGTTKENVASDRAMPEAKSSKFCDGEKQDQVDGECGAAEEKTENFPEESVREESVSTTFDDDDDGSSSEVDKRAAEFIAKFREQIMLQRVESLRRSSAYGQYAIRNYRE